MTSLKIKIRPDPNVLPLLGRSKKVYIEYPDVGDFSEGNVLAMYPLQYPIAQLYGVDAVEYASALERNGLSPAKANAIQHAYWAALLTRDWALGVPFAVLRTTAHEHHNRFVDTAPAYDSLSDLHNNYVGIQVVEALGSWCSVEEVKTALGQKLSNGELWIVGPENMVIKSNGERIYGE